MNEIDRAYVLVRAPAHRVVEVLAPFARFSAPRDAMPALAKGERPFSLEEQGRAIVWAPRGGSYTCIVREGPSDVAYDVPLARRLSALLGVPAVAIHFMGGDAAWELFHEGRSLESFVSVCGEIVHAESSFGLDERVARDPYGHALAVLGAYGFADDRIGFADFERGDIVFRRWDVTVETCFAYDVLLPWPVANDEAWESGKFVALAGAR